MISILTSASAAFVRLTRVYSDSSALLLLPQRVSHNVRLSTLISGASSSIWVNCRCIGVSLMPSSKSILVLHGSVSLLCHDCVGDEKSGRRATAFLGILR